jgi:pimeloyl-ACP methyl ester carboxylesterase
MRCCPRCKRYEGACSSRKRGRTSNTSSRAPTLILWGTADRLIPPASGQLYQQRIPNSLRMYIYGGAHSLPVAKCMAFVDLTTEFIARGEAFVVNTTALA